MSERWIRRADERMPAGLSDAEYDGLRAAAGEVLWTPGPELPDGAPAVVTLPPNLDGRDIVLGDVHGQRPALVRLFDRLKVDLERDRLVFLGDLIDRGEDSWGMLEWLDPRPGVFVVRGNHEQFLLLAPEGELWIENWDANGGEWHRYHPDGDAEERLARAREPVSRMPFAIALEQPEGDPIVCVHAEVPTHWSWPRFAEALESGEKAPRLAALWGRNRVTGAAPASSEPVPGARLCIHGHTPQQEVLQRGNSLWIDTGTAYPGRFKDARLTALVLRRGTIVERVSEKVETPGYLERERLRRHFPMLRSPLARAEERMGASGSSFDETHFFILEAKDAIGHLMEYLERCASKEVPGLDPVIEEAQAITESVEEVGQRLVGLRDGWMALHERVEGLRTSLEAIRRAREQDCS